jgi:hypothetical protein
MKYPKRNQYKHTKSQYRVRNWPEYEAGLQKRGDLHFARPRASYAASQRCSRSISLSPITRRCLGV